MTRIYIFCEGRTEESFVTHLLVKHFEPMHCYVFPIIFNNGPASKGGVTTYGKIRKQIAKKCTGDPGAFVTTMIDYYGLPRDFPGMSSPWSGRSQDRVRNVLQAFQEDIGQRNFVANLLVHEFEALLFCTPDVFAEWVHEEGVEKLRSIRRNHATPEDINQSSATAPSKRIRAVYPLYDKVQHGTVLAEKTGLDVMRSQCPFFNVWLTKLEHIARGEHNERP